MGESSRRRLPAADRAPGPRAKCKLHGQAPRGTPPPGPCPFRGAGTGGALCSLPQRGQVPRRIRQKKSQDRAIPAPAPGRSLARSGAWLSWPGLSREECRHEDHTRAEPDPPDCRDRQPAGRRHDRRGICRAGRGDQPRHRRQAAARGAPGAQVHLSGRTHRRGPALAIGSQPAPSSGRCC